MNGVWILLFFSLMIVGGMMYLFITGEFYELDVIVQLADQMNTTPHDLGIFVFICLVFLLPFVILPLIAVIIMVVRGQ